MGRTKGATNKEKLPEVFTMPLEQRLDILAALVMEIVAEELTNGGEA